MKDKVKEIDCFLNLLCVVLVFLKLFKIISRGWLWVFSSIILNWCLATIVWIAILFLMIIIKIKEKNIDNKKKL